MRRLVAAVAIPLLTLTLLPFTPGTLQAAETPVFLPGGGMVTKTVTSKPQVAETPVFLPGGGPG
jgi:hypothetical protein